MIEESLSNWKDPYFFKPEVASEVALLNQVSFL